LKENLVSHRSEKGEREILDLIVASEEAGKEISSESIVFLGVVSTTIYRRVSSLRNLGFVDIDDTSGRSILKTGGRFKAFAKSFNIAAGIGNEGS
jgi:predicted transcriptional regulator